MAIVHFALAVRDVRCAARFFESTLLWRPIDRPGNIALASAWLEIAPGQEVHLLEVADYSPSPFEREYGHFSPISTVFTPLDVIVVLHDLAPCHS